MEKLKPLIFLVFMILLWMSPSFVLSQNTNLIVYKDPPCQPAAEGKTLALTGIVDFEWSVCWWYFVNSAGIEQLMCEQVSLPLSEVGNPIRCKSPNSTISGGTFSLHRCNLVLESVSLDMAGQWKVNMTNANDKIEANTIAVEVARPAEVILTKSGSNVSSTGDEVIGGTRLELTCIAAHGVPRTDTFNWTVNGQNAFLLDGSWSAVTYPVEFVQDSTNVSQQMSILAPADVGEYIIRCEAIQFDFQHSTSANFTLQVIEDASALLGDNMVIVISLAAVLGLVLLIILILVLAYCLKCMCFSNKRKQDTPRPYQPATVRSMPVGGSTTASAWSDSTLPTKKTNSERVTVIPLRSENVKVAPSATRQSAFTLTGNNRYNYDDQDGKYQPYRQTINGSYSTSSPNRESGTGNGYSFSTRNEMDNRNSSGLPSTAARSNNRQFLHIEKNEPESGSLV